MLRGEKMETIQVKVEDNTGKVIDRLDTITPLLLNAIGSELYKSITNFMTEDDIIDTRRLIGSISYCTPFENYKNPNLANTSNDYVENVKEKDTVLYGSNVEYANYVETGTSRQRARKYLETGTYRALPETKQVLTKLLKGEN